ncbi:MAG: tetraacyldisaccharide 4'-kinase [Anditalea sp.]
MRPYDPILYPFSLLYDGITRLRNRMFDLGMKKSVSFEVPTIVVGNLSLGGTGKTPMVEFLLENFKTEYRIATLSRGYGRKTSGFLLAKEGLSAKDIGDEPLQIFNKYSKEVTVAVGEERILAIPQILADRPGTNLIILDDAFQHRYVKGDFNILLTTYHQPFFRDRILPLGTLREHNSGAKRADAIVVTKCPGTLENKTKEEYRRKIREISGDDCLIIFAELKYGIPYAVLESSKKISHQVILVSGIANSRVLKEEVSKHYDLLETLEFPDHHKYSETDMTKIMALYKKYESLKPTVLTTEKDAVKLKDEKFIKYLMGIPIFALPVGMGFNQNEKKALLALTARAIGEKKHTSGN